MTKLPHQEQQQRSSSATAAATTQQQQQQQQQQQHLESRPSNSSSNNSTSNVSSSSISNTNTGTVVGATGCSGGGGDTNGGSGGGGGGGVNAPLYVTSVPSLASAAPRSSGTQQRHTNGRASEDSCRGTSSHIVHHQPLDSSQDTDAYKSGDELELTQDLHSTKDETTDEDLDDEEEDEEDERGIKSCSSTRSRQSGRRQGSARRHGGSARSCEPVVSGVVDDTGSYQLNTEDEHDRSSSQKIELDGACLSESGDSLPGTPEKTYGLVSLGGGDYGQEHRGGSPRGAAPAQLDPSCLETGGGGARGKLPLTATSSGASSSSRKSGGSSSGGGGGGGSSEDRRKRPPPGGGLYGGGAPDAVLTDASMISMVEFDPTHREMAVDVPDTFVARTKTPPRYPPPKSSSNTPHYHHNNNNSSDRKLGSGGSSGTSTPLNGTLSRPVAPPRVPDQTYTDTPVLVQSPNSQEEETRIKKYEDELRLRREREEEAAMLRSSLRSSQKLQSLASTVPPAPLHGLDNQAYAPEDSGAVLTATTTHPLQQPAAPSPRINELIQSLQRIQSVLQSNGHRINEDVTLVAQLLSNPEFQKVLAVHNKVQQTWCVNRPPTPVQGGTQDLMAQVLQEVQQSSHPAASELVELLSQHAVEGLLYTHDRLADREPPSAPAKVLPGEASLDQLYQYPHPSVRIVRIDKTNEPLGATIRNEGDSVVIGRIVKGGAAEKSGKLHEGDEILEVNGVEVRSKSVNDVCDMLAGMTGTLTFIIIPGSFAPTVSEVPRPPAPLQTVHVKAHFDYDPEEDLYIPCRELGMSFQKGDILHVLSQADPSWWQAYREGEEDQTLAGLIPSKTFQQQREAMRQTVVGDTTNKEKSKKGKQLLCAKKHQKKKKKKMLYSNYNDDFDNEEILTYEEVALYYPRANCKRPVVLIGPPNIGRHELRQKLMEDRERFAAAIPHTSRPRRDKEVDGQDYHFISRAQFEEDILQRKFVEHGEFEKAYYGTSLGAIRTIVSLGKICVLNLHALSLKILKNSDLKPFVVFIAPPSLEKLRQKKQRMGEPVKDEELKEIMEKAREMEDQYGHYFDLIIINQDVESSYQQLLHHINMLEREPQWVPGTWLADD